MSTLGNNPTSYFSTPANTLDPKLFQGRVLQGWVRQGIRSLVTDFLGQKFRHADLWSYPWLAGSGVSYQWSANRQPGDLDCLVGVDFIQFRKANPEYQGLSDGEIAALINDDFKSELDPKTENWNGYELTFYVNPQGTDIKNIRPYAAYDLKHDEWTVVPDPQQKAPYKPEWDTAIRSDANLANQASTRFTQALQDVSTSQSQPLRRNAEARLSAAADQALSLYEDIHRGRSLAFSKTGEGYADFHNYRWQAAKRSGTVQTLRKIKQYVEKNSEQESVKNYGVTLPDTSTLVRRAATYRQGN